MWNRLTRLRQAYPRQFWLLFWGMMVSTIGASMIWPFLMIYASERLSLPLTAVASLMTLNAGMGLLFSFIAGPIIDRLGRKWVMVISLLVNGVVYLFLSQAQTFPVFALLMSLSGAFNPLYRVGADAMMADLVPPGQRVDAYSLLRTSNNLGIAIGPMIGGFIATTSYTLSFYSAASGMILFSLLIVFFAAETLPQRLPGEPVRSDRFGGYGRILHDRQFMSFAAVFTLTQMCAAIMWVLLSVYTKQNYGIQENQYGLIPTTNALMVVLFQISVTMVTKRYAPLAMMALGTLFYGLAMGTVALSAGFWGFLISMVILTIGELILSPTATTLAANMAPADMRGRYMSVYGLTWSVAAGIGPVLGGFLNDQIGPRAIWYGGFLIGMLSTALFVLLWQKSLQPSVALQEQHTGD